MAFVPDAPKSSRFVPDAAPVRAEEPFMREARDTLSVTPAELIAANPAVRMLTAAARPVLGAAGLVEGLWGGHSNVDRLRQLEQMQRRGNDALGLGPAGTAADISGALLTPLSAASKLPAAATYGGKVLQGLELGGLAGVTAGGNAPLTDAAVGSVIGGAIPAVAPVARAGYHAVEPWISPAAIKGRAFLDAAGDKADEIIALLRANKQVVPGSLPTAGEAAVPSGRAEFAALQRSAAGVRPSDYLARSDAQNAARIAALRTVGQTPEALAAAEAERAANAAENYGAVKGNLVSPASDTELMQRAIMERQASKAGALQDMGRFQTTAAQAGNRAEAGRPGWLSNADRAVEAQSAASDTAATAAYRQKEADYLRNAMFNLKNTVGLDDKALSDFLGRPSMQAAVRDAMKSAQETGAYFPRKLGDKFSVANLQRIKESLDAGITASKHAVEMGVRPQLSEAELSGTRDSFIKWLSNKSPGWKDARHQYAADSIPVNQMQIGQYLESKLVPALSEEAKQKASTYATALENAPATIKKATGAPRYEQLSQILSPEQLTAVNSVRDDLARGARFDLMASKGAKTANAVELATQSTNEAAGGRMPNLLYRPAMVMNAIISRLQGRIDKKLAAELAVEMLNPPAVAESLAAAQARAARNKLIAGSLRNYSIPATAATAQTVPQAQ